MIRSKDILRNLLIPLTTRDLSNSFKNASQRRHLAAHDINAVTPINDLNQFINEALATAITFDLLLSQCLKLIRLRNRDYIHNDKIVSSEDIKINFIKLQDRLWKYRKENNSRSTRTDSSKTSLLSFAENDTRLKNENLIIFDNNGFIESWAVD